MMITLADAGRAKECSAWLVHECSGDAVLFAQYRVAMPGGYQRITMSDQDPTPFGRVLLAGEVSDAEPLVPGPLHSLSGTVISLVTEGEGYYRHADLRTESIVGPSLTVVLPGEPHWYGTHPGRRWSEWFAVVEGPVFDLIRQSGRLTWSGPRPLARGYGRPTWCCCCAAPRRVRAPNSRSGRWPVGSRTHLPRRSTTRRRVATRRPPCSARICTGS
ncbi:hypothetical protein GJV80_10120 [Microlunatus sp. Gsoil 973]|nr:hypothetical protein GJV80_10120 [Microlunatus sp. Gsoil 973]